ncbi:MAG: nitrile hydratase subunit alpha [Egibacteraceae bacterium]
MTEHHADAGIAQRVRAVEAALEERGVVDGAELDAILDRLLTSASPLNGARVIARAWTDGGFRERLLTDANTAIELGFDMGYGARSPLLRVVENTETVHNVIVCTLCSCYPLSLLGPSPSWYKSPAYRSRVVRWPREVLAEFGLHLDPGAEIRVWDASAETRCLVLPRRPGGTGGHSEEQLAALVTRGGMIGTSAV